MSIYYNGNLVTPSLEVPQDIYNNVEQSISSITLSETTTVYIVKPTSAETITFNTDNLRFIDTKYVTFRLVLDMTDGIQTITWPSNIQWSDSVPSMTETKKYMFSFTKPAGENTWIGNQMFSWQ